MNIHLVTDTTGFPYGTAAARRIRMIGKALIASGNSFSVYTGTLKNNQFNKNISGEIDNIQYRYLHGSTQLPIRAPQKMMLYIKGIIALNTRLRKMNPLEDIVYVYSHGTIYNIITLLLCKFYTIKKVEEINEWDYEQMRGPLRKFIFQVPMVKWADGAIVISKNIEDNILRINPNLKTLIIPVLDDPAYYESEQKVVSESKYVFWMGLVDGYIKDVLFIIESCALAYQNGCAISIVISGPCNTSLEIIKQKVRAVNFPEHKLKMVGYLSEDALHELCRNALFYIVPLWEDQKSVNRFPTKIATFMFCGKPVLTCNIGEVGRILTENINVIFYKPGDCSDLATKIGLIYNDISLYNKICSNAKQFATENFGYDQYIHPLKVFFGRILEVKKSCYVENSSASHA